MNETALLFWGAIIVLGYLVLKDHMAGVSQFFSNLIENLPFIGGSKDKNDSNENDDSKESSGPPEIHEVVDEWEILRGMCQEANLKPAVAKLDELFPLLNRKG